MQSANVPNGTPPIVHSHFIEWWDVRTPGAFLKIFDFLDYTFFFLFFNFSRLLVSFASLAELHYIVFFT